MQQDPGDNDTIQNFCLKNYGVTFPVLGKTEVNGEKAAPVWEWMKAQKKFWGLKRVKWNFEKFLIGRDGVMLAFSFSPVLQVWLWVGWVLTWVMGCIAS